MPDQAAADDHESTGTLNVALQPTRQMAGQPPAGLGMQERRGTVGGVRSRLRRHLAIPHAGGVQLVPITRDVTHVGRGLAVDIRLEDQTVSRRHAVILSGPDGTRVLDDRSANGTWVNGRRIADAPLRNGDVLALGAVVARYIECEPHGAERARRRAPASLRVADGSRRSPSAA